MAGLRQTLRRLWQQQRPQGQLSWRFLLPAPAAAIRLQRQLWWHSAGRLPRGLWLLLELLRYLRWQTLLALPACLRTLRRYGPALQAANGPRLPQQALALLRLACGRCLPPVLYYAYQLYRPERDAWTYLAPWQHRAFHHWRNRHANPADIALLRDKVASCTRLAAAGLAVSRTLCLLPAGAAAPDWSTLGSSLFLKPQYGAGGQHCFVLQRQADGSWHWQQHDGTLQGEAARQAWQAQQGHSPYLVQPCYRNVAALAARYSSCLTLRLLTQRRASGDVVDLAILECPLGHGYQLFELALDSGTLQLGEEDDEDALDFARHWQQAGLATLPHWQQAQAAALQAHALLAPSLFSVAWDFVVSDQGCLLLEGNSHWGIHSVQQISGGLLAPQQLAKHRP